MSTHDILRDRILLSAGITRKADPKFKGATFTQLQKSEWSPEFEQLMRNRLVMGALRYSPLAEKKTRKHKWDLVGAIEKKISLYNDTGNLEYLVDIANYCLLEFECGAHPKRHFHALDDHHDHCKEIE